MSGERIGFDEDLAAVLRRLSQPLEDAARELMVFELYRLGEISRGRAAELSRTRPS